VVEAEDTPENTKKNPDTPEPTAAENIQIDYSTD
jgi:hypothetical protein